MRLTLTITLMLLCLHLGAQQLFTERLQQGNVTLHQSNRITDLVNGSVQNTKIASVDSEASTNISFSDVDESIIETRHSGLRVKMNGYRIQVYAGGNSRQNKQQAENAGNRVRNILSGESIYTNFISPRWICRVGDYRSYEEAYNALQTLKSAGGFSDAVIVKSKVQIYID